MGSTVLLHQDILAKLVKHVSHTTTSTQSQPFIIRFGTVCTAWRAASLPLTKQGLLSLQCVSECNTFAAATAFAAKCPNLCQVDISGAAHTNETFLEALAAPGKLTALGCNGCCSFTDQGFTAILRHCRALRELQINDTGLGDLTLWAVGLHCPGLTTLEAARCTRISEHGVSAVITRCLELRKLDLSGCGQLEFCEPSAACVLAGSSLVSLNLQDSGVCDDALRLVSRKNPALRSSQVATLGATKRLVAGLPLGRRWGVGSAAASLDSLQAKCGLARQDAKQRFEWSEMPPAIKACSMQVPRVSETSIPVREACAHEMLSEPPMRAATASSALKRRPRLVCVQQQKLTECSSSAPNALRDPEATQLKPPPRLLHRRQQVAREKVVQPRTVLRSSTPPKGVVEQVGFNSVRTHRAARLVALDRDIEY